MSSSVTTKRKGHLPTATGSSRTLAARSNSPEPEESENGSADPSLMRAIRLPEAKPEQISCCPCGCTAILRICVSIILVNQPSCTSQPQVLLFELNMVQLKFNPCPCEQDRYSHTWQQNPNEACLMLDYVRKEPSISIGTNLQNSSMSCSTSHMLT